MNARRPVVLLVVSLVVLGAIGPAGSARTISQEPLPMPGSAPDVALSNATVDPVSPSTVNVSYNATGTGVSPGDLEVFLTNETAGGVSLDTNASLTTGQGIARLAVPGAVSTNFTAEVLLFDNSSGSLRLLDNDTAIITVQSSSGSGGASVTFSDTTVDSSQTSTVYVEYNATATGLAAADLLVQLKNQTGVPVGSNASLAVVDGNASLTVSPGVLTSNYTAEAELLDNTTYVELANDTANVTVVSGGDSNQGSNTAPSVTVSDQTVDTRTTSAIPVSYNVTGFVEASDLNVTLTGPEGVVDYNATPGTSQGSMNLTVPAHGFAGNYSVVVRAKNDSSGLSFTETVNLTVISNVSVTLQGVSPTSASFYDPFFLNATVTNAGTSPRDVRVPVYRDGGARAANVSTVTVNASETTVVNQSVAFDAVRDAPGTHSLTVNDAPGRTVTVDPRVTAASASVVRGPTPVPGAILYVEGYVDDQPMLQLNLRANDSTGSYDVADIGVNDTSLVKVELTVEDFTPRLLLGAGDIHNWTRTANGSATDVTLYVEPVETQYRFPSPPLNNWPGSQPDQATVMRNASVGLAVDDMSVLPAPARDRINGTVIATDAQAFGSPRYSPGGSGAGNVTLFVAGPHLTVDGAQHVGYYSMFLPDAVLGEWGVSNATQLQGAFAGSANAIAVQNVSGGLWVEATIHYSSGTVEVTADTTAPSAVAAADVASPTTGETVTFDASGSTDAGSIANYDWDLDGDGTVDATGVTATHAYTATGSVTVTLTVSDAAGNTATDTVVVDVSASTSDTTSSTDTTEPTTVATPTATATPVATTAASGTPVSTATPEATTPSTSTRTPVERATTTDAPDDGATSDDADPATVEPADATETPGQPGFGPAVAVLAVLLVALGRRRR